MALKNTFLISSIYKRKLSIAWILAVVAVVGLGWERGPVPGYSRSF